jgi:hypothetical protein
MKINYVIKSSNVTKKNQHLWNNSIAMENWSLTYFHVIAASTDARGEVLGDVHLHLLRLYDDRCLRQWGHRDRLLGVRSTGLVIAVAGWRLAVCVAGWGLVVAIGGWGLVSRGCFFVAHVELCTGNVKLNSDEQRAGETPIDAGEACKPGKGGSACGSTSLSNDQRDS